MKAFLLNHLQESKQCRLRQLLENMPLGDCKPSQLYHDMVYAAKNAISDSALQDLWYTRLPESVASSAMITTTSTIDKLRMADITYENWQLRNSSSVKSASITKINTEEKATDSKTELEKMFTQFTKWLSSNDSQRLSRPRERSRSRSYQPRDKSQNPPRENSRTQRRSDHSIDQFNDCWYHRTFGNKATSCKKPCTFQVRRNASPSTQN